MISLLPFQVESPTLRELARNLPFKTRMLGPVALPSSAFNRKRNQYLASELLAICKRYSGIVLGITDVDLYAQGLNFVFGQAELYGRAAVVSLYRLRGPHRKFIERAIKEAVHEIGHLYGLEHCSNTLCVMHFSNCLADTDRKSGWYCSSCEKILGSKISHLLR